MRARCAGGEADLWRRLDRGRGRIALEDVGSPDFDVTKYGLTYEQAMGQIHGVLPSGAVVRDMEVFRRAYAAVGWGWLLAPTAWPLLRPLFDRAYRWYARNRLRLTGRRWACGEACASRRQAGGVSELSGVTVAAGLDQQDAPAST